MADVRRGLTVLQLLGKIAYSGLYGRTGAKKPYRIGYNSGSFDRVRIINNELLLLSKPVRDQRVEPHFWLLFHLRARLYLYLYLY